MKKYKLSPWHDGSVKPVHVGVYETGFEDQYQYWNGEWWGLYTGSVAMAYEYRFDKSLFQYYKWRGILKD